MACEIYRDIVEHFSAGISVWSMEHTINEPTFRLVGMNKQAREKLNSSHIEVGLILHEMLRESHADQVAATFFTVLQNNKEISLDQFTLDGKAQFSVKITPFKYNCVGVMFGNPKAKARDKREKEKEELLPQSHVPPMNYSIHAEEIFKQAFEYNPMMLAILKRVDIGNKIDFQSIITNAAGRSARKRDFRLVPSELCYLQTDFHRQAAFIRGLSSFSRPAIHAKNSFCSNWKTDACCHQ